MSLIALLIAAAPPAAPDPYAATRSRYNACLAVAKSDPDRAVAMAQGWRIEGGGVPARHCLGLAQAARGDTAGALLSLETAAGEARAAGSALALLLWQAAAEIAADAGKPDRALADADAALAIAGDDRTAAPLHIVRAQALVDLKRDADAMAELDDALHGDPDVPWGWLLKATLARRTGDLAGAETAILEAGKRTPDSPEVQYEAGNIAAARGHFDLARQAWTAAASDGESVAGRAAAKALADTPAAPASAPAATPLAPPPSPATPPPQ
ncbi:hypothetical protein IP88_04280 [alpha proteobacterium AAP81b]|nr:hypothetical protein IP88_04280 [alpha proteobacterium AAP81b]